MSARETGRALVLSPWGVGGGYSGPVVFLDRLFAAVAALAPGLRIDVLYRDRGGEVLPRWATRTAALSRTPRFGTGDQLRWGARAALHVVRHRGEYDVVHLQGVYLANLLPALFARRGTTALLPVLEGGDLAPGAGVGGRVKTWLLRRVLARAGAAFAISAGIARELAGLGLPADRVVRIGNAVSEDEFGLPGQRQRPGDVIRLGFIGKLGPIKRPHLLLEALAELRRREIPATAVFVGPFADAGYEREFRARIAELALTDAVELVGLTSDVASVAKTGMDVFVLPSSSEGMPGALAEAMMMALPCIVTDVGAMGDVVRAAGCGAVIEPTAHALAQAVAELATTDALWGEQSRRASEYAGSNFASRTIAARYLEATRLAPQPDAPTPEEEPVP